MTKIRLTDTLYGSFMAEPVTDTTAKAVTFPINPEYGLDDLFLHENGKVILLLNKVSYTKFIGYGFNIKEGLTSEEIGKIIINHFKNNGIKAQLDIVPCSIQIAVPIGITDDTISKLIQKCPEKIKLLLNPDEYE